MVDRLELARKGDPGALEWAHERYFPGARRWVRARLPERLQNTPDIERCITDAFTQALTLLDSQDENEGRFQLSLRGHLQIRLRNLSGKKSSDETVTLDEFQSLLEGKIGPQSCRLYESALDQISDFDREVIVGRIEFGFAYGDLAEMLGKPTPDDARTAVKEALTRLVEVMCDEG